MSLRLPPQYALTSACSRAPVSGVQRRIVWSSIETTSSEPSGIHPSPDGRPSTSRTCRSSPPVPTLITRWRKKSDTHQRPSCHRGDSKNAPPSSSVTSSRSAIRVFYTPRQHLAELDQLAVEGRVERGGEGEVDRPRRGFL